MGKQAIDLIVGASALVFSAIFAFVIFGAILLRRRRPDHARPFKFPGGLPALCVVFIFACGVFLTSVFLPLIASGGALPLEWMLVIGWGVLGLVFYIAAAPMRKTVSPEVRRRMVTGEE